MAKFKPGIPDSFTLNVDPIRDLGDYLDEPRPTPVVAKRAREEAAPVPPEPVAQPAPQVRVEVASPPPAAPPPVFSAASQPVAPPPVQPPAAAPATITVPAMIPANAVPPQEPVEREEERGGKAKAPRREISMTPETLRMSDELLEVVRSGSGQRDTKANELFHALVLLVYEVIDDIDPHTIPKRGRWGTPTARAYPIELRNAFLRALLEKYGQGANAAGGLKYPVNTAA